jgi:hypothetical protein
VHALLGNSADIDSDGFLTDVVVQPVNEDTPAYEDKRCDIIQFFHPAVLKDVNGKMKKYSSCKLCPYVWLVYSPYVLLRNLFYSDKKSLVDEVTTLQRHLEASHLVSLSVNAFASGLDILLDKISQVG